MQKQLDGISCNFSTSTETSCMLSTYKNQIQNFPSRLQIHQQILKQKSEVQHKTILRKARRRKRAVVLQQHNFLRRIPRVAADQSVARASATYIFIQRSEHDNKNKAQT